MNRLTGVLTAAVLLGTLCVPSSPMIFAADVSLADILPADSQWELVSSGHEFTEGPASDPQGCVYFSDVPRSQIHKIELDGKVNVFVSNSFGTNGLMFGPDGKLYGCQNGKKKIVTFNEKGETETIADEVESNDLVVNTHGGIYFSDPSKGRIWYITPKHEKKIVAEGLRPNGVILTPDEGTLVVTDGKAPHLWAFKVEVDGSLSSKIPFYGVLRLTHDSETPGSDGLTLDKAGRIYVATRAGVQFFDEFGRMSGVILKPQPRFLSNATFGGPQWNYLYVTCTDKVFRRKLNATGWVPFKTALDEKKPEIKTP